MKAKKIGFFIAFAIGILSVTANQLFAQSPVSYPDKPITIIVPYPPGGLTIPLAELLGKNSVMPGV